MDQLQAQLGEQIVGLLDSVLQERQRFHATHPAPRPDEAEAIIEDHARRAAALVSACNLVPGPLGMLGVVPEVVAVLRLEFLMVSDLAWALGHPRITRELLLGILLLGMGGEPDGLLEIHGGRVAVKRASDRLVKKLVGTLAARLLKRLVGSAVARWLPVVGLAALAARSYAATARFGAKAREILARDLDFEGEELPQAP